MKQLTEEQFDSIVREAVQSACESLDAHFPGCDKRGAGGITSQFAWELEQKIRSLLTNPIGNREQVAVILANRTRYSQTVESEREALAAAWKELP